MVGKWIIKKVVLTESISNVLSISKNKYNSNAKDH